MIIDDMYRRTVHLLADLRSHKREDILELLAEHLSPEVPARALFWYYDPSKTCLSLSEISSHPKQDSQSPDRPQYPMDGRIIPLSGIGSPEQQMIEAVTTNCPEFVRNWAKENGYGEHRWGYVIKRPNWEESPDQSHQPVADELSGVVQLLSTQLISHPVSTMAQDILVALSTWGEWRFRVRVRQLQSELTQAFNIAKTSQAFLAQAAKVIKTRISAEVVVILRPTARNDMEAVADSRSEPGQNGIFSVRPNGIIMGYGLNKTIRLHNISDHNEVNRTCPNVVTDLDALTFQTNHYFNGTTPRAWMASPIRTQGATPQTIGVVLALNHCADSRLPFKPLKQNSLEVACTLLGGLLPRMDATGAFSAFSQIDFRTLIDKGHLGDNPLYRTLSQLVPGFVHASLYRRFLHEEELKRVPLAGNFELASETPLPFVEDLISPINGRENFYSLKYVFPRRTNHNRSTRKNRRRCEVVFILRRRELAEHEMELITFVAEILQQAEKDFFEQAKNLDALVQIRHALRSELNGASGNIAVLVDTVATTQSPEGSTPGVNLAQFRRSILRANTCIEQATILTHQTNYLLGRITSNNINTGEHILVAVLRDIQLALLSEIERKRLTFTITDKSVTNSSTARYQAIFDKVLIRIMFFNLIDNAVKYAFGQGFVTIELTGDHYEWSVSITDRGDYISESDREDIFIPYHRSESATRKASRPGTGLGLAIAKDIAEAHGGSIECVSKRIREGEPAADTTFIATLPRDSRPKNQIQNPRAS